MPAREINPYEPPRARPEDGIAAPIAVGAPPSAAGVSLSFVWTAQRLDRAVVYAQEARLRHSLRIALVAASAGIAALGVVATLTTGRVVLGAGGIGVLAWNLGAVYLGRAVMRLRFARSPYRDQPLTIRLDDDRVVIASPIDRGELTWLAFTRAYAAREGVLLFQGALFRWLPFDALQDGARPDDLVALIGRHVNEVRDAR